MLTDSQTLDMARAVTRIVVGLAPCVDGDHRHPCANCIGTAVASVLRDHYTDDDDDLSPTGDSDDEATDAMEPDTIAEARGEK